MMWFFLIRFSPVVVVSQCENDNGLEHLPPVSRRLFSLFLFRSFYNEKSKKSKRFTAQRLHTSPCLFDSMCVHPRPGRGACHIIVRSVYICRYASTLQLHTSLQHTTTVKFVPALNLSHPRHHSPSTRQPSTDPTQPLSRTFVYI